jgi:hypothetical protein
VSVLLATDMGSATRSRPKARNVRRGQSGGKNNSADPIMMKGNIPIGTSALVSRWNTTSTA